MSEPDQDAEKGEGESNKNCMLSVAVYYYTYHVKLYKKKECEAKSIVICAKWMHVLRKTVRFSY